MRTRMSGGVTGKAGDSLPMSIRRAHLKCCSQIRCSVAPFSPSPKPEALSHYAGSDPKNERTLAESQPNVVHAPASARRICPCCTWRARAGRTLRFRATGIARGSSTVALGESRILKAEAVLLALSSRIEYSAIAPINAPIIFQTNRNRSPHLAPRRTAG